MGHLEHFMSLFSVPLALHWLPAGFREVVAGLCRAGLLGHIEREAAQDSKGLKGLPEGSRSTLPAANQTYGSRAT